MELCYFKIKLICKPIVLFNTENDIPIKSILFSNITSCSIITHTTITNTWLNIYENEKFKVDDDYHA